MEILIAIVAFVVGGAIAWLLKNNEIKSLSARLEGATKMIELEKEHCRESIERINEERRAEREAAEKQRNEERETFERQRIEEREATERQRIEEREAAERQRRESDEQWQLRLEAVKKDILRSAAEQAMANGEQIRRTNTASMDELLKPVKEQFEAFRKSVEESSTQNEVSKKEIQEKFDSTLKLFQQQQEMAVRQLCNETTKIGNDAVNLAKALKTNSKRQGNWGEMVLQTMLENSGLEENVHYFIQYNVKDEEGKRNIPDVVVKFPEGRSVIIDSKVSLTAYTQSFETEDEDKRRDLLKAHLASVEKHIDELSIKNYPRVVENSMDYVMMFIPNESSYIEAMKLNTNLLRDAYNKKVIVVSPNNLMMALQLAFNLWQNDKQIKNVEKIVARGKQLYEKVYNFQESFNGIGELIGKLRDRFDKANAQLSAGPGNVLRQCEMLEEYGIHPESKKRIKSSDPQQIKD